MSQITEGLISSEEDRLVELMGKVGSAMSNRFFNAVATKFALIAIETVVLRQSATGTIQVLLTQRPLDDSIPAWRGMWHSPGTMLRASDRSYEDAFARVQNGELGTRFLEPPRFVDTLFYRHVRGSENPLIFVCEIEGEPRNGKFFDVESLPENLTPHHQEVIRVATQHYQALKDLA